MYIITKGGMYHKISIHGDKTGTPDGKDAHKKDSDILFFPVILNYRFHGKFISRKRNNRIF
jgi:hypothetical protein